METPSTCCYCGVGCGVLIRTENGKVTGVRGDPAHPANFGRLCTEGATLHLSATQANRALYPELRKTKAETRQKASWDVAITHAAARGSPKRSKSTAPTPWPSTSPASC
jgi:assimilatory nitrate reductase catalytic subunit